MSKQISNENQQRLMVSKQIRFDRKGNVMTAITLLLNKDRQNAAKTFI